MRHKGESLIQEGVLTVKLEHFIGIDTLCAYIGSQLSALHKTFDCSTSSITGSEQSLVAFSKVEQHLTPLKDINCTIVISESCNEVTPYNKTASNLSELTLFLNTNTKESSTCCLYGSGVFNDKEHLTLLSEHITTAAKSILSHTSDTPISSLQLLGTSEIEYLSDVLKGTKEPQKFTPPHTQIELHAKHSPDKTAIKYEDSHLSYQSLNDRANRVAQQLQLHGVSQGDRVATFLTPSLNIHVALMAIMKLGATYVPIDPEFPQGRVDNIIDDATPTIVLINDETKDKISYSRCFNLSTNTNLPEETAPPILTSTPCIESDDVAYIYYTSGTTGRPKGVKGTYGNLQHYLSVAAETYGINASTHMPAIAKFTFSISMFELLTPLIKGGTVSVLPREDILNVPALVETLKSVNTFHIGPSLLRKVTSHILQHELDKGSFSHIRHASSGGDMIPVGLLHDLNTIFTNAEVFVIYGCSEIACMGCTYFVDRDHPPSKTLVGKPFANTRVLLLDEHQNLVPNHCKGEIYFAGEGVTAGYLNRPELTNDKYLYINGERYYRTGDIGRLDADGNLEMLGRNDFQVQIRGVRVELGEVDYYLRQLPGIKEAIASSAQLEPQSENSIYAYIVAENNTQLSLKNLKQWLANKIPEHMMPSGFVVLDALPLNHNLKVDRKALPTPTPQTLLVDTSEDKANSKAISMLSQIWTKAGLTAITESDMFFDFGALGIESIEILQLRQAIKREIRHELPIKALRHDISTPNSLAKWIERHHTETDKGASYTHNLEEALLNASVPLLVPSLKPSPESHIGFSVDGVPKWYRQEQDTVFTEVSIKEMEQVVEYTPYRWNEIEAVLPLTPEQEEIWLSCQLSETASRGYNLAFELTFSATLNIDTLKQALLIICNKHQSLRGFIHEPTRNFCIERSIDISIDTILNRDFDFFNAPFDLSQAPLFRVGVAAEHLSDTSSNITNKVWLNVHHIIADGWSINLLAEQLCSVYESLANQVTTATPLIKNTDDTEDAIFADSYEDALLDNLTLHQESHQSSLNYWKTKYSVPAPPLDLPTAYPRGATRTYDAAYYNRKLALSPQTLKQFANHLNVTSFTVSYSIFLTLLNRLTSQEDLTVGVPLAGQILTGSHHLIAHNVKTLPLRHQIQRNVSFKELVQEVDQNLTEATEHGYASYGELLPHIDLDRNNSRPPLISTIFTQDPTNKRIESRALSLQLRSVPRPTETFDTWFNLIEVDGALVIESQYNTNLFNESLIEGWCTLFDSLLSFVIQAPQALLWQLPTATTSDIERIANWNATETHYTAPKTLQALFALQVEKTPNAIAIQFNDTSLTYLEFDQVTNQLAHSLIEKGVEKGNAIGVYAERSLEMMQSIYAIIKVGGVYVPLDPEYPTDRIEYILQDSQCQLVLSHGELYQQFSETFGTKKLHSVARAIGSEPKKIDTPPSVTILPEDEAYIIYTSGSTGKPKGVINCHDGIANRLLWKQSYFQLTSQDRVLFKTPFSFDVSIWEIFWPQQTGAKQVIAPPGIHKDPDALESLIIEQGITIMHFVPSMLSAFINRDIANNLPLRAVLCSGEALTPDLQKAFFEKLPNVELHNLYGPTEAAVDVTHWKCIDDERSLITPIGSPIANTQIHIVDEKNQPQPIGVAGELLIGGVQVAKGYLNRPDLNSEKFIADPFKKEPDARAYRTGDLARWNHEGQIEYLGRLDFQVKIRGLRIEIGEIETLLNEHNDINQAVVVVQQEANHSPALVAFYTSDTEIEATLLRQYLGESLPQFMIPQLYQHLPSIPLTTSGKADRKVLMALKIDRPKVESIDPPATATEQYLASHWRNLLKIETINRSDDFTSLGGHSLLLIQLISTIKQEVGVKLSFDSFTLPLQELALKLDKLEKQSQKHLKIDQHSLPEPEKAIRVDMAPEQREVYLAAVQSPHASSAYNLSSSYNLHGPLDVDALEHSLQQLINRHQALRTTVDTNSIQFIIQPNTQLVLDKKTLDSQATDEQKNTAIDELKTIQASLAFQFGINKPLSRMVLLKVHHDHHILMVTFHHLIADGWSKSVFLSEFTELYRSYTQNQAPHLPTAHQLKDYIECRLEATSNQEYEKTIAYWAEKFSTSVPDLELPSQGERTATKEFDAAKTRYLLDKPLSAALKHLATEMGTTLFGITLASYTILLHRLTQQTDLCIGVPFAGQPIEGMNHLMGQCARVLPLRIEINPAQTFRQHVKSVANALAEAYEHCQPTFTDLFEKLNISGTRLVSNIFSIDQSNREASFCDIQLNFDDNPVKFAVFELGLTVGNYQNTLSLDWIFNTSSHDHQSIIHWLKIYEKILQSVTSSPAITLKSIQLLTDADKAVLDKLNHTEDDFDLNTPATALIEQWSTETPDAIAIQDPKGALTYRQLNEQANILANRLHQAGIRPGDTVALCMNRGVLAAVAMNAVHKAGASYLPLGTNQPEQRLNTILQDVNCQVVLSNHPTGDLLKSSAVQVINPSKVLREARPEETLGLFIPSPSDCAYIIYTSGSTGTPKGVRVSHSNMMNMLRYLQKTTDYSRSDTQLAIANFTFDPHVFELFLPLITGATCVIAPESAMLDAQELSDLIDQYHISVMQATPVTWRALAKNHWKPHNKLKVAISGGEALPEETLNHLLQNAKAVINAYGPTETTVLSTAISLSEGADTSVIGQPIANTQVRVVDDNLRDVPLACDGELLISGSGVSIGYINKPQLNAQKFLKHPEDCITYYRTGDKVRVLHNGEIQFRGRIDDQIKLRGLRIEPTEIEQALERHPNIDQAVVVLHVNDGKELLVSFYRSDQNQTLDSQALRSELGRHIPNYMIPQHFEKLDVMPLTSSGKVNRNTLKTAKLSTRTHDDVVELPTTDTEIMLAQFWCDVLERDRVSIHDDFFSIGGHSLAAVKVLAKINNVLGISLPINVFLQAPVLKDLADFIDRNPVDANQRNTVTLKESSGTPLFCLYGVLLYKELAEALPGHQKVIGVYLKEEMELLKTGNLQKFMESFADLELIAKKYAQAIQSIQPHGPYYLAGESFGGVAAFEVAQYLIKQGERVELVAMMDSWLPSRSKKIFLLKRYFKHIELFIRDPRDYWTTTKEKLSKKLLKFKSKWVKQSSDSQSPTNKSIVDMRQRARDHIVKNYTAQYYSGTVVLFRASERSPFEPEDTYMGWAKIAPNINVVQIEGDHLSILRKPNVKAMARHLSAYLPSEQEGNSK
ncbi:hypothetical protein GCM10007877_15380 [Marinibactrum halimedae]|uniref:Carrier domain-containing protein n=1 Tax=Marinibactrum halimedae TaxID=1444977 RepID=A0AA37T4V0_9GAMM|nr:hypothetical protein GCM10007877_15380 [Marinibactrum halimedae]